MRNKNTSPIDWYIGSYLLRFIEIEDKNKNNPEQRFLSWENTIIVKAKSFNEAYKKVVKVAKSNTKPYRGGEKGIPVQWVFEGVTELLPIYEELEDGSEIMWAEHTPRKLKNLRKLVKARDELNQ